MLLPQPILASALTPLLPFGWLLAAAAPLLIHLWNRSSYRESPWAAMEYLLAALERQMRRLQLEQLLLLALRTLLIVLAVLAVIPLPFLEHGGLAFSSGGATHRVLVIDGSYSMAYRNGPQSLFDRAKELAQRIVRESPQGDAFTLVLMASPPRVVVATPAFEPAAVRDEIDNLELLHTGADLPATVAAVRRVVERAGQENPRLAGHKVKVYFLTDLQRSTWSPELGETAKDDFRRQSQALANAASLVVIDLGQPGAENVAVTGLGAVDPVAVAGRSVAFEATVKNFGSQPRNRQAVQWLVDRRRSEEQVLDLPPGAEKGTTFSHRFQTPGDHTVEVRAAGDALEIDNHRYLVVPVRQSIRVLCINGRPSGEPYQGASDYLAVALGASGGGEPGHVVVDVAAESALMERDLGGYDCVFLCDVAQFTASEARVLDAYLGRGGNLVFFLGGQVQAERYNRELGGGPGRPRILPARLGSVMRNRLEAGLDPLGYRHPIVRSFESKEKAGLLTTPVVKYYRLEIPKKSTARTVLATGSGDPLIVEQSIRKGRVVLVATSADQSWTYLPLWPSFVPLVQEILNWCAGGQIQQRNFQVGDVLTGTAPAAAVDAPLWLSRSQRPDDGPGERLEKQGRQIALHAEGDYSAWSYPDTWLSGIYTATLGPPANRSQSFAVNVDTRESDLAAVDVEDLKSNVWPEVPFQYQTTWQQTDAQVAAPVVRSWRLPVLLLYAVLGLLVAETFLAWRFGHHGT
jgi:hypothetical protein